MNRKSPAHRSHEVAIDSLRDKVSETGHNIAEIGHIAKRAATDKIRSLKRAAYSSVEEGKDKLLALEGRLEGRIKRQPMKSVLIAAGIGLAMGLIFRKL
jgi:ElaB/YqjD/DUF883 family membrane-anchored ribosome-binding protein